ncbi:MAG: flap endonuclease [Anaerolineales bacterium]|uniref:5'-3' exonuclease n=1 Tax=Candidatus Villigracilis vicinus TaxID=3140679 RepID=UPI0031368928|nr:flap endonuclease [Anaerolineales bacterium]
MKIHLVDGTYELFRAHFGAPPKKSQSGQEVGATLGMLRSMLLLLSDPEVTHVAVAFDHVIESFRNKMYKGYKSSEGVDPIILNQFPVAEAAIKALGLVTWPMVKFEADDAIATAVAKFKKVKSVEQIVICSVDKDLTQMVDGDRVICWDRRREITLNEKGVIEKFGVSPESIPDFLALVGDSADGYPGIQGWGEKSTSTVLAKYKHIESIPKDPNKIPLGLGRATTLLGNLQNNYKDALLFRELSTLRTDVPLKETLADLKWQGAYPRLKKVCKELRSESVIDRVTRWR